MWRGTLMLWCAVWVDAGTPSRARASSAPSALVPGRQWRCALTWTRCPSWRPTTWSTRARCGGGRRGGQRAARHVIAGQTMAGRRAAVPASHQPRPRPQPLLWNGCLGVASSITRLLLVALTWLPLGWVAMGQWRPARRPMALDGAFCAAGEGSQQLPSIPQPRRWSCWQLLAGRCCSWRLRPGMH